MEDETQKETVGVIGVENFETISGRFHDEYQEALEKIRHHKLEQWVIKHISEIPLELRRLLERYFLDRDVHSIRNVHQWLTEHGYQWELQQPEGGGIKTEGNEMSFSLDPKDFKLVIKKVMWEI